VDLSYLVGQGVFKAWEDIDFWKSVHVNLESHTVCWGKDIDLDPYVLKQDVLKQKKISFLSCVYSFESILMGAIEVEALYIKKHE